MLPVTIYRTVLTSRILNHNKTRHARHVCAASIFNNLQVSSFLYFCIFFFPSWFILLFFLTFLLSTSLLYNSSLFIQCLKFKQKMLVKWVRGSIKWIVIKLGQLWNEKFQICYILCLLSFPFFSPLIPSVLLSTVRFEVCVVYSYDWNNSHKACSTFRPDLQYLQLEFQCVWQVRNFSSSYSKSF